MKTELIHQELYGKSYKEVVEALSIEEDQGDCCGFTDVIETSDHASLSEDEQETTTLVACVLIRYDDEQEEDYSRVVCNFVFQTRGGQGVLFGYDMTAGSGSGWAYGAFVSLKYNDEEIACVSW